MDDRDPVASAAARRAEIAANLSEVRARISAAAARAGRSVDEITLVGITKTWPAADVVHLAALGVRDVGENRDQEAAPKAAEVATADVEVRWHFVGGLQRNKCGSVARYAAMVHSVDSVRLANALDHAAARAERGPLDVLVQVSLDADPLGVHAGRGGAVPGHGDPDVGLDSVLAAVAGAAELRLRGLMAVAPIDEEPARAFARLAELRQRVRRDFPDAGLLSAGMSGDVEDAIDYGATHVRMGTALLGNRPGLM